MTEFTDDEAERVRSLVDRNRRRAERREDMHDSGDLERDLASFLSGLAGNSETVAIGEVHVGNISTAQDTFERAADYYHQSAEHNSIPEQGSLSLEYAKAIYVALLAGSEEHLVRSAEAVRTLEDVSLDAGDPNADRLAFSRCLAGAVLDDVSDEDLDALAAVNEEKPARDAQYGSAILAFSRGIRDRDESAIESGIESMLTYHDEQRNSDNVIDRILAVQATALSVLARNRGFDVQTDDEFYLRLARRGELTIPVIGSQ